ncbi:thrombospondin, type I repeat containing protein [Theileria orientalis strain Shintoku]|uniref:Thrombospondin, type I repeat containing protein n=1 Tax=Theileria orientalis strain Shintoku TaxID=869250 RepID=J4DPA2_THEOR|nr:thrombospondin, type I repeat containing protein [Theileria orientalis strain Shintoku]BAM40349.1 thrombospondin, type I repeat containing protein [Theileria orientalis strain Shintoku]|eukprot:XP_009690650.1 thrombospondin, type I repeat containing protein [Theileria orientalis strain Shintoku]
MLQYSISSKENQGQHFGVSFKTIKFRRSLKRSLAAASSKDRALSQTMPPKNEVEESVPDKIYTIHSTELPRFSCPAGHYIGIVNSYITCNSKDFDVFEETWSICRNKTNCVLDVSVYKNCTDKKPKFKYLQYSCFKIQAFDCGLFYPYDQKDEEFCLSLCRYYMRDCTAKYDQVPREYFIQCLEKMFFRNVSSQCGFLPNSIDPEHASFSWNKYMKKKYYHDNPNVTNKKWKTRNFKNEIENPVVFTAIPQDYGSNLKVLVKNVTNVNFKVRFLFMECDKKCFEKDGEVSEKVEYLAVSHGNHSSDMKNQIIVGSIQSETNNIVKLPLDPSLEWVVITQIQNDSLRTTSDVLPVIYTSLMHYNKRYFVDFYVNSKPEVKSVVLGYLAISKNELNSSSLYQTELKYLQVESRNLDKVAVNISLGFNFDHKSMFGITTYESTLVTDVRQSVNDLYTAGAIRSPYSSIMKRYNIQVGFRWIAKTRGISKGPRLDVLFVEKSNFTTIKQICMFTRRLNYRSKRSCYSECISSLYLRECLIGEIGEFLNCYKERSQNCEIIELEGLNEFINENKDSILSYYSNKAGKKPVDDTAKVETKKEDEKKPEETLPVEEIVNDEIPHLPEIYSEWSSWSKCSSVCDDGINKAYESRTRLIYAESNKDYESEIMEKRDCTDLVECDKLCYYRNYNETKENGEDDQDAGNDSQTETPKKMYFFIWNPDCKMKPEDLNIKRKLTETQLSVENKIDYSKECDSDYNWSACDAPCESDLQTREPQRHLLINIKCESNVKRCENLKKCVFSNSNDPKQTSIASYADIVNKYENEMCLLYNSLYDDSTKSWTNNGSCKCPKGTVPCNSNEIYFNKNNQHILNDNYSYISSLNETRLFTDVSKYRNRSINKIQKYISLSDNERIVMPFKYVKVLTYDKFASDEKLANFCSTGNIHFEKIPDNLLLINCNNIYSEPDTSVSNVSGSQPGYAITTDDCKNVCKQVEKRCMNMHNKLDQKELVECFIDKISRKTNLLEQSKTLEAIKLVDNDDKLVGELCTLNKSNNRCKELATNAVYDCKNRQHHRNVNIKTRQCILDHYSSSRPSKSVQNCKFKRRKVIGSGLIFCKHIKCNYTKYSEWFQNTVKHSPVADKNNNTNIASNGNKINLFNSVKLQIVNDLMKRGIKSGITNDVINEIVKGLNVNIKIRIRYRNQTNDDPYCNEIHQLIQILTSPIIDNLENVSSFVDTSGTKSRWNNFSNRSSIIISESDHMESLVAKPSGVDIMKGKDLSVTESSSKIFNKDMINRNCNIYLGQKQLQNTKLIIQTNRCSCPSNTHACSIEESLNSKRWIKLLDLVCLNKMRSILFSNSGNFYRFSCLSKSFIKEDFESIKQLCNEDDEMTFISCYGEPTLIEVYIVATLMGIIGVISSILLIIYISKRRSLIKFR